MVSFILHKEGHSADPLVETIYDIFTVAEFCFFAGFFYYIISDKSLKKIIPVVVILFVASSLIDFFLVLDESFTSGVQAVLILIMCIYYFFDQLKKPNSFLIYNNINFWVIISFLIYVAGTFFLYIMAENMVPNKEFRKEYVIINFSFNLLKNILLSVAMLMKEEKVTPNNFTDTHLSGDWDSIKSINNLS